MASKRLPAAVLHEEKPYYMRAFGMAGARFAEGNSGDGGDDQGKPAAKPDDKGGAGDGGDQGKPTTKPDDKADGKGGDAAQGAETYLKKQLADAQAKLQKIEDEKLTTEQKEAKKTKEALDELARLRIENSQLSLLSEHNIPAKYKSLISGTTKDEQETSAKLIAELLAGTNANGGGDDGGGDDGKKGTSGVVTKSGTGGTGKTASISSGEDLYHQLNKKTKE